MQSLDEPHLPEYAASRCRLRPQQQPGDGVRIRAIACAATSPVTLLPSVASQSDLHNASDLLARMVEQIRFGSFNCHSARAASFLSARH